MKAAIYCRLSEEDRNKQYHTCDSVSIQNQKTMLLQYAIEQGWEIYNIYSDDDYTGSDRKRPQFNRLLEDAQNHKFNIILCKTQSRFTRELELVEKYIHGLFPLWGIRFISIVDNADTDNKGNKKSRQINGLVNEWYLEDMSDNIRSVLTNRRKNGLHIGSFALYGYLKDPDNKGHLIIDKEAAEVVREVFTLFSQGYGKTAIARILNDRGIPNPTEYKRLKGMRYKQPASKTGTLWKYSAISKMLTNEIYIGNMVQGKYGSISYKTKQNKPRPQNEWYIVENTHEPVIDRQLWERVQSLIEQRAKPFSNGKMGLFANKAKCLYCGCSMRSSKSHGHHYLQCSSHHFSENACKGSFISVKKLEEIVIAQINCLSSAYMDKEMLENGINPCCCLYKQQDRIQSHIDACKNKAAEYTNAIRQLYMDKVKGIISEKDFMEMSENFTLEKHRMTHIIDDNQNLLKKIEYEIKNSSSSAVLAEKYTNLRSLNREIVDYLIDYIYVGRRIIGTGDIPIEIHWRF